MSQLKSFNLVFFDSTLVSEAFSFFLSTGKYIVKYSVLTPAAPATMAKFVKEIESQITRGDFTILECSQDTLSPLNLEKWTRFAEEHKISCQHITEWLLVGDKPSERHDFLIFKDITNILHFDAFLTRYKSQGRV